MSFRSIFIIRQVNTDNDLQPFCYKPFINESKNSIKFKNFNEWYTDILLALQDNNYWNFNEHNIDDYISNPLYRITTKFGELYPCLLIVKNKFVYGGLLSNDKLESIETSIGTSMDFISNMSSYFGNILKKNNKIKMSELIPEFYNFIKIMCPYGVPLCSSINIMELFKYSDSALKSIHPYNEKRPFPIDQIPQLTTPKSKEFRIYCQEIISGYQYENSSGECLDDLDIIGEVIVCSSNTNVAIFDEVSLNLVANNLQQTKYTADMQLVDILLHPCVISSNCSTSHIINTTDKSNLGHEVNLASINTNVGFGSSQRDSSLVSSPQATANSNSPSSGIKLTIDTSGILQSLTSQSLLMQQYHHQQLSNTSQNDFNSSPTSSMEMHQHRTSSLTSGTQRNSSIASDSSSSSSIHPQTGGSVDDSVISIKFRPRPSHEIFVLMTYRIMRNRLTNENQCIFDAPSAPFVCTYRLEDWSNTQEANAQIQFNIRVNPELLQSSKSTGPERSNWEFSKFEVVFPMYNRPGLTDISKCNVSMGKLTLLEQNRNIMLWSLGSNFKFKSDATLNGQLKFSTSINKINFTDNFCIGQNAYAQVNYTLKSSNVSGLCVAQKSFLLNNQKDSSIKLAQKQECSSLNYRVWNSLGDCPREALK